MKKVNDKSQIIYVPISNEERNVIFKLAEERGVLNHKTLMDGEGNSSGYAGELIVSKLLKQHGFKWVGEGNRDCDFISPDGHTKIDVKTKGNAYQPRPDFDCTVPQNQRNQNCTHYIFVRINKDTTGGWVNGWITKEEFRDIAKPRYAGQAYNNAGRLTRDNHDVVLVSDLYPIANIQAIISKKVA